MRAIICVDVSVRVRVRVRVRMRLCVCVRLCVRVWQDVKEESDHEESDLGQDGDDVSPVSLNKKKPRPQTIKTRQTETLTVCPYVAP